MVTAYPSRIVFACLAFAALLPAASPAKILKTKNLDDLATALRSGAGVIELPQGVVVAGRELVVAEGSRNLEIRGHPQGSILRASEDFRGRAVIVSQSAGGLRLRNFRVEGSRRSSHDTVYLPPSDVAFARFYTRNGLLVEGADGVRIENVSLREIAGFAILVSASRNVSIRGVTVEDSGSLDAKGRNNTSGGILLEEGTASFEVRGCTLRRIRGNAIWTHSNFYSPRNGKGLIAQNIIEEVARDAIQVGHATEVRVENNTGRRIGYPTAEIDAEGQGIPVGLDTAGNVDKSAYSGNRLEDVNGRCIDLDGFHDGEVVRNTCISRKPLAEYPFAHYGIAFNNSHPEAQSRNVTVAGNRIEGAGYGGIFLIGSGHRIIDNQFLVLNRAGCTGTATPARCAYALDEPGLLRSGIYLGRGAARPAETTGNEIRGNRITGFGMGKWCIGAAPGVSPDENRISRNTCTEAAESP